MFRKNYFIFRQKAANEMRKQVFLSHAGEDAEFALHLAAQIEEKVRRQCNEDVQVFCTSDPERRFRDLKQVLRAGSNWSKEALAWKEELRQYLRQNLLNSAAYVLLVTRKSVLKNSEWIAFEIDTAYEQAQERLRFFIPCVAKGATFVHLPTKAREFQGISLNGEHSEEELVQAIAERLAA